MKILKRFCSGVPAPPGVYIQSGTGQIRIQTRGGKILGPIGDPDYLQVPIPRCLALILGPVLGGIYFLALPFLILGMAVCVIAGGVGRLLRGGVEWLSLGGLRKGRSQ